MRVSTLILLSLVCVTVGFNLKESLKSSFGKVKGALKAGGRSIKTAFTKIKHVVNSKMVAFKKKLSKLKGKILKKLHLTQEERKKLWERLKFFKRKSVDKVQPTGDTIEDVNLKFNISGEMFQGDMALTKEQQNQVEADITETDSRTKRQAYNDKAYPGKRWFKGVNYFFERDTKESVKSVFKKAAQLWMADTCIDFNYIPFGSASNEQDSIRVYMEDGCWSFVGRLGGIQNLSLSVGCDSIGTASHELGHALGLFHTHSRYDRNQFITVDERNIMPDWVDQFVVETPTTNNNYNITYDYGSLMHYGATSSSVSKTKLTMVPKDVQYTETLGSPFIGFYDLLMINTYYNCTDNCKGEIPPKCQNFGYANPRNCSKCVCPSGYGGDYCEKRPPGCGAELEATSRWQLLTDDLGDRKAGGSPREDFMKCNYWIKAPFDKKIEVKMVSFTEGVAVDGCTYAGVEIKTHSDQRLSGRRFCSKDSNAVLRSNLNRVPVITYNRIYATVAKLEYRYV